MNVETLVFQKQSTTLLETAAARSTIPPNQPAVDPIFTLISSYIMASFLLLLVYPYTNIKHLYNTLKTQQLSLSLNYLIKDSQCERAVMDVEHSVKDAVMIVASNLAFNGSNLLNLKPMLLSSWPSFMAELDF